MSELLSDKELSKLDKILTTITALDDDMFCNLYGFLKKQYSDVCSNRDVVINQIIDYFWDYCDEDCEQENEKKKLVEYVNSDGVRKVSGCCISYLNTDIKRFIDSDGNIKANPFWAS